MRDYSKENYKLLNFALSHLVGPKKSKNIYNYNYIDKKGRYKFVAFTWIDELLRIFAFLSDKSKTFLDVGSGYGNILFLAKLYFDNVEGVEIRSNYVLKARETLKNLDIKIHQSDAFKFTKYHNYDVIYLYQPIADHQLYRSLLKFIINESKSGAYIIDVAASMECAENKKLERVEFNGPCRLYKKL